MSICYCLFGAFSTASFFSVQIKEREQFKATTAMFLLVWVTLATFYFISSDILLKWFLDSMYLEQYLTLGSFIFLKSANFLLCKCNDFLCFLWNDSVIWHVHSTALIYRIISLKKQVIITLTQIKISGFYEYKWTQRKILF